MSESPSRSDAPGLASRRLAWDVLEAVAAGAYADVALENRALRHRPLGAADRGLATELAYGAIRWRQWLDAWIDKLGKVPARKQPPRLRWLLHIGLYQLLRMERIPAAAAAVNTSVELAKTTKLARLAPVVNGLLRAALRAHEAGEGLPVPETLRRSSGAGPITAPVVQSGAAAVVWPRAGAAGGAGLQPGASA